MKTATVYWLVMLAIFAIIVLDKPDKADSPMRVEVLQNAEKFATQIPQSQLLNHNQHGKAVSTQTGYSLSSQQIQAWFKQSRKSPLQLAYSRWWLDDSKQTFTESSMALDRKHYIANSFLVGIQPFTTENPWLPLYTLANRKSYQYDSEQYSGADVWQNSAQAFKYLRGDCEDHAIVLADWLISMGIDARVVLGRYKEGGHAWVVAFMEGEAYILEATSKRDVQNWKHYPLASVASHYYPTAMFNRTTFWMKHESTDHRDYSDTTWEAVSTFERDDSI